MFPHTDASNESWGLVGAVLLELLVVCFLSRDLVFIAGDLQQVWYGCWLWLLVSVGVYVYLVDLFHIWYSLSFFIIFHHVFHVLASAIVSFFHSTVSLSGLFVVWINLMKWNLTILNFVPRSQSFDLVNLLERFSFWFINIIKRKKTLEQNWSHNRSENHLQKKKLLVSMSNLLSISCVQEILHPSVQENHSAIHDLLHSGKPDTIAAPKACRRATSTRCPTRRPPFWRKHSWWRSRSIWNKETFFRSCRSSPSVRSIV